MSICFSYFFFPLRAPNITPDITAPIAIETIKNIAECTLGIAGITNIPPWGAGADTFQNWLNPPAIAAPITQELITLTGSLAAKGIAPSVIKDKPSIKFEIFSYKELGEILKIEKFIYWKIKKRLIKKSCEIKFFLYV